MTTDMLVSDFSRFVRKTDLEAARLTTHSLGLESSSSLIHISNEGLFQWIKEKLTAIGRKFVIIVNKFVAKFSKNREAIEKRIKEYEQNPKAEVSLPLSPKAMALGAAAIAATAVATVTIIKLRKDPNAKEKIGKILEGIKGKLSGIKGKLKRNKTKCTAGEAAGAMKKQSSALIEAEKAVKAAGGEMSKNTEGKKKEDVQNSATAAEAAANLMKECDSVTSAAMAHGDKADATAEEGAKNKDQAEVKKAVGRIQQCIKDIAPVYSQCKDIVNEVKKRSAAKGQPRDYTDELKGDMNQLKSTLQHGLKEITEGVDASKAASIASNCEGKLRAVNKKYMDTLAKKWYIK